LNQTNISLLSGEKTNLPLNFYLFQDCVDDIKTVISISRQFFLKNNSKIDYFLDSLIYGQNNINYMLDESIKFMIELPETTNLTNELLTKYHDIYEDKNFLFTYCGKKLYATTERIQWDDKRYLWAHIVIDPERRFEIQNNIENKVLRMYDNASYDPSEYLDDDEYLKFLIIEESKDPDYEYSVEINKKAFQEALINAGYFVFLSNDISDTKSALSIYKKYTMLEKAFSISSIISHKDNITDMRENCFQNTFFIVFLSLILTSHIQNIMNKNKFYNNYTIEELYFILRKFIKITNKNGIINSPLTDEVKKIYDLFDCPYPGRTIK
jgi:hypothetical protein